MRAFTKMDTRKIGDRSEIARADFVVYLDETLFDTGWDDELKDGGVVLVNSARSFADPRVIALDANGISLRFLGREIPNTTFLAAIAFLSDALTVDDVRSAIRQYMAPKLHEGNLAVVDEVEKILGASSGEAASHRADAPERDEGRDSADERARLEAQGESCPAQWGRRDCVIPRLRGEELDPFEFARTTTWTAGHLVTKNSGWRVYRPVLDEEKCTGCLQCYMQCPDGAVFKTDGSKDQVAVAIDYDFCKGCGICVKACNFAALEMVPEGKVD